jgi:hypothetical protein
MAIRLDAVAGEHDHTVTVTVTTVSEAAAELANLPTLAIDVDGRYFVAVPSPSGAATFWSIPGGQWNLRWLRGRPGEAPGFALPLPPRRTEFLAADERRGTAVLEVVLAEGWGTLILHRERDGGYLAEVALGDRVGRLAVVTLRFGRHDGGEGLVAIPLRRSGLARLDDFSPVEPWQASVAAADELPALPAATVTASVRACANNATRLAWSDLARIMPEIRQQVARELEG